MYIVTTLPARPYRNTNPLSLGIELGWVELNPAAKSGRLWDHNETYFILTWYRIVTAVISVTPGAVVFTTFQRTFTFIIIVAVTVSFPTLPTYITAAFFIAIFSPVAV